MRRELNILMQSSTRRKRFMGDPSQIQGLPDVPKESKEKQSECEQLSWNHGNGCQLMRLVHLKLH